MNEREGGIYKGVFGKADENIKSEITRMCP